MLPSNLKNDTLRVQIGISCHFPAISAHIVTRFVYLCTFASLVHAIASFVHVHPRLGVVIYDHAERATAHRLVLFLSFPVRLLNRVSGPPFRRGVSLYLCTVHVLGRPTKGRRGALYRAPPFRGGLKVRFCPRCETLARVVLWKVNSFYLPYVGIVAFVGAFSFCFSRSVCGCGYVWP